MNVRFFLRESPRPRDGGAQVEYVEITSDLTKDVVSRLASDADRALHARAYAAFKSPAPAVEAAVPSVADPPELAPAPPAVEDEVPADTVVDKPAPFYRKRK